MGDVLRELADRIVEGKTVAFIGAGASVRSNYPLWGELLDDLRKEAEAVSRGDLHPREGGEDLRWLAQYYSTALRGKLDLAEAVENIFNKRQLRPPDRLHELIAQLPINHFVTTNYDDLIEDACNLHLQRHLGRALDPHEKCGTLSGIEDAEFSRFLRGIAEDTGRRSVLHLHGALRTRDITLSLADYVDQYMQEAMPDRIYTIFATATVLFVGSSLTDPDIMSLILRSNFHGEQKARHFAFLPLGYERFDDVLKQNYGIEPIRYRVVRHDDGRQDHSDLDLQLTRLVELVEARLLAGRGRAGRGAGELERVKGNAAPVTSAPLSKEERAELELVKDGIRKTSAGLVTFSMGDDEITSSRLLRRLALDYRNLPARHRFRRVVFLSPSRLGLFPGHRGPRSVVHSVHGETTRALGHYSLTSTTDPRRNISAMRHVATFDPDRPDKASGRVTLFVVEDGASIYDRNRVTKGEMDLLNEQVQNLPPGSVVVRQYTDVDRDLHSRRRSSAKWMGMWRRVALPARDRGRAPAASQALVQVICGRADGAAQKRRLLATLAVLANPASSEELTAMIGMAPFVIEDVAAELASSGLVETERAVVVQGGQAAPPPSGLGRIDIASPVRWGVLDRVKEAIVPSGSSGPCDPAGPDDLEAVFTRTVKQTFDWAEGKVYSLRDWEHDNRQARHLNAALPNLLAIFEAADWLRAIATEPPVAVPRLVKLGNQLAYTLFSLGRWGEAVEYMRYLTMLTADGEDDRLVAEVQILHSRMLAFTAQGNEHYEQAKELVTVQSDDYPRGAFPQLGKPTPYSQVLRQRAAIRRGVAEFRHRRLGDEQKRIEKALEIFTSVYDEVYPEGDPTPLEGDTEEVRDAALSVRAEAAEWLVETRFATHVAGPDGERLERIPKTGQSDKQLHELLRMLDQQRMALGLREDRRRLGHYQRLRGDALLAYRGPSVARRYFARALVVAWAFRDRHLEAGARLGLARCDRDRAGAEAAARIFTALDLPHLAHRAEGIAQTLPAVPTGDSAGPANGATVQLRRVGLPKLVVFFGEPGTRRSLAVRSAARVLSEWGLDPRKVPGGTIEELADEVRGGTEAKPAPAAGSTPNIDLWVPLAEREEPPDWILGLCRQHIANVPGLTELPDVLCVHLHPERKHGARNWVDAIEGAPAVPEEALRWDTIFEEIGAAYVGVDSNVPILDLTDMIRRALAFSYLADTALLEETRDLWRPPLPWSEARAAARDAALAPAE